MKRLLALLPICTPAILSTPVQAAEVSVVALPNPIGIPEVIVVVALLIVACWKKSWVRIFTSIGVIIWGAFFTSYDIIMAAPVLVIGVVLFIIGIMNIVSPRRAQEV